MKGTHIMGPLCFVNSKGELWECPEHFKFYRAAPDLAEALKLVYWKYAVKSNSSEIEMKDCLEIEAALSKAGAL